LILALIASALACEGTDEAAVLEAVALVHGAFQRMDAAAVRAGAIAARAGAACLDQPIAPATASKLHGAVALSSFLGRDVVDARAGLQAARNADSTYTLPLGLPPQHPMRKLEPVPPGEPISLPDGDFLADGVAVLEIPGGLPVVLQRTDGGTRTAYLPAPIALPPWALAQPLEEDDGPSWGLAVAAGVAGIGAGAALLVANAAEGTVLAENTPYEDLGAARNRANAASWTSIGLGAAGVGLGVATVLTW